MEEAREYFLREARRVKNEFQSNWAASSFSDGADRPEAPPLALLLFSFFLLDAASEDAYRIDVAGEDGEERIMNRSVEVDVNGGIDFATLMCGRQMMALLQLVVVLPARCCCR